MSKDYRESLASAITGLAKQYNKLFDEYTGHKTSVMINEKTEQFEDWTVDELNGAIKRYMVAIDAVKKNLHKTKKSSNIKAIELLRRNGFIVDEVDDNQGHFSYTISKDIYGRHIASQFNMPYERTLMDYMYELGSGPQLFITTIPSHNIVYLKGNKLFYADLWSIIKEEME